MINNNLNFNNLESRFLERRRIRQEYKSKMESAVDQIGRLIDNSKANGFDEYELSSDMISPVVRYYRKYWLLKDMGLGLFILTLFTFFASFYDFTVGIYTLLIAAIWVFAFGESHFIKRYFSILGLTNLELYKIENKLFPKKYNLSRNVYFLAAGCALSMWAYLKTKVIFLDLPISFLEFIKIGNYDFVPQNELFAYTNVFILILFMLLRVKKII